MCSRNKTTEKEFSNTFLSDHYRDLGLMLQGKALSHMQPSSKKLFEYEKL